MLSPELRARAMKTYAALPMMFEANNGQTDARVKFLARGPGYTLFLTDKEAVLSIPTASPAVSSAHPRKHSRGPSLPHVEAPRPTRVVRLRFAGASAPAAITGQNQLPGKTNYFIGNDPKQWHTNVSNYSAVEYRGIYPGVDAIFRGDKRRLEFDFDLAPGADPSKIALEVQGARRMRVNSAGDVLLRTDGKRDLFLGKPHIYQQSPAGRSEIAGHFVLIARNRIAFELSPYDHSEPLVIDPTLTYSTYLGGSVEDLPYGIAADSSGSAYVTGVTYSPNFPIVGDPNPYQSSCTQTGKTTCTPGMAFVTKFTPDGTSLVYSTFLNGHTGADVGTGIGVDSSGYAYILGAEQGELDFPTTTGAIQTPCNIAANLNPEVFVAKLDQTGSNLLYSTCLQNPEVNASNGFSQASTFPGGIAVDGNGNAYVTGSTDLPQDFPTTQTSFQTTCQVSGPDGCAVNEDPFVVKISPTGTLVYSTFLSGGAIGSNVISTGIAVDSLGDAYVIGYDNDVGAYPAGSPGGLITTLGSIVSSCPGYGCGGFLAKMNGNATALAYSTYLANVSDYVTPTAVAVDQDGYAYVSGYTSSTDFPSTMGVLQYYFTPPGSATTNLEDGFVIKMDQLGDGYAYATLLGGTATDTLAMGIGVDAAGHAFVTGVTDPGYPTIPGGFQTTDQGGANQIFFSELDPIGASLLYSTFLAGTTGEAFDTQPSASGVSYLATDPMGNAYVTGQTDSTDFPTTSGAFQKSSPLSGGSQSQVATGFVAKFTFAVPPPLSISPNTLAAGTAGVAYPPVTFTTTGGQGMVTISEAGSLPPGMVFSNGELSGTPTQTGSYPITIGATDSQNDTATDPLTLMVNCPTITVGSNPSILPAGTVGTPYSVAFNETGGVGTIMFSQMGLPDAIGLSFAGAVLSGTPTSAENFSITVTATDSNGCQGSVTDPVTINPSTGPPPPVVVMDSETITVSDRETFPDVADNEPITVSDAVTVTPLINFSGPAAFFSTGGLGFNGVSGAQPLTVSNVGKGSLVFSGAPAISSSSGSFTITQTVCSNGATSLPTTLPSGGACTLTISYAPSGTPASDTGTIVFSDNAALSSPASSGTGPTYMQTISLNGGGSSTGPLLPPSATVTIPTISEMITVTDMPVFPDVADSETITVNDVVSVRVQSSAPAPTITSIKPNSGLPSGGETTVITGQNFQSGATVVFGSTPATSVTVNSATSISAVVPALPVTLNVFLGLTVTVTNPDGQFATGTFIVQRGVVSVLSISPTSGEQRQTFDVTLTGGGFVNGMTVTFGTKASGINVNSVTVTDPDHATANITIAPNAPLRTVPVSVTTGNFSIVGANFTVQIDTLSVSPNSGERLQAFDVVLTGGGFVNGVTTAKFGNNASGITVNSVTVTDPDHATANITIAYNAPIQRVDVSATTAGSTIVGKKSFTVQIDTLSISPNSGERLQTFDVVLTGGGFVNGVTTAKFGNNASGITVNSVTVTDPDHATANITIAYNAPIQRVDVSATTAGSTIVGKKSFTVQIDTLSISPNSGERLQTFDVVLTGGGFVNGVTTAKFGNNASGITVNSVTVTDPDHATANITIAYNAPIQRVDVSATTAGSTIVGKKSFTVQIDTLSISPNSGERLQTFDVVLTGGGFVNGVTTAKFGNNASGITVNSVTVTDPDHATANITIAYNAPIQRVDVSATTAGSTIVGKKSFTVQP